MAAIPITVGQVLRCLAPTSGHELAVKVFHIDENDHSGPIVSVEITPFADGLRKVGHAPFSLEALAGCTSAQSPQESPTEDFKKGYAIWREAFDAGKAGVFSIDPGSAWEAMVGVAGRQHD